MRLRHALPLGLAAACAPPAAHVVATHDATTTTEPATTTTTTTTVVVLPTVPPTTLVLPEDVGAAQTDDEWWAVQPGYDGTYPAGACGGDLPPCWVLAAESGGDIRAVNPYSGASGKWQFMPGTWAGYGGYATAAAAPEAVQDERARQVWASGAGCRHWDAC